MTHTSVAHGVASGHTEPRDVGPSRVEVWDTIPEKEGRILRRGLLSMTHGQQTI
jgi:hypothetical protein